MQRIPFTVIRYGDLTSSWSIVDIDIVEKVDTSGLGRSYCECSYWLRRALPTTFVGGMGIYTNGSSRIPEVLELCTREWSIATLDVRTHMIQTLSCIDFQSGLGHAVFHPRERPFRGYILPKVPIQGRFRRGRQYVFHDQDVFPHRVPLLLNGGG